LLRPERKAEFLPDGSKPRMIERNRAELRIDLDRLAQRRRIALEQLFGCGLPKPFLFI
jgi:hypothetical protein